MVIKKHKKGGTMKMFFTTLISLFAFSSIVLAQPVMVCDDIAEWPPYIFWERIDGKINKKKLKGASIEVLDEISKLTGLQFKVELYPWKRCLKEVKDFGTYKKFEMFMDGSYNEERAEKYYLTSPIYNTSAGYWYSRKKYPNGLTINTFAELKKYKLCGVRGNTYVSYGFPNNDDIDTGAATLEAALKKVAAGRCDLVLQAVVVPYGFKAIGKNIIPEGVVHQIITEAIPGGFYIFISKSSPRAYELLTRINQAVVILDARGVIDKIMNKYLPTCGRNC